MRPSWIEVDLEAVSANTAAIAAAVAPAVVCAVVKADGYGHGDVPVAEAALAGGATWLAVALVEEATRLRDAGIDAPILLLSEPPTEDVPTVVHLGLVPTVYRPRFAGDVAGAAASTGRDPYPVHLKIDTGMHRVGASEADGLALARSIVADRRLQLAGLWTHFAVSESDREYTDEQLASLLRHRDALADEGIEPPFVHAANTAAALDAPATRLDLVRVGLGIYGLHPAPGVGEALALRPAMRVVSHVSFVRRLPAGARPSYGRVRQLTADAGVATVPIGYADGFPWILGQAGASVLIGGVRYPLAGSITMDQALVEVGDADVGVGDEVVLLGRQGEQEITAEEWAGLLGTINYEVVCRFGPRLPRRYVRSAS